MTFNVYGHRNDMPYASEIVIIRVVYGSTVFRRFITFAQWDSIKVTGLVSGLWRRTHHTIYVTLRSADGDHKGALSLPSTATAAVAVVATCLRNSNGR